MSKLEFLLALGEADPRSSILSLAYGQVYWNPIVVSSISVE